MVHILFFASFREQLNTRQVELELTDTPCSVADLMGRLIATGGEAWQHVLGSDNLVIAVNQSVCSRQQAVCDGDEVAFYPPVTGG